MPTTKHKEPKESGKDKANKIVDKAVQAKSASSYQSAHNEFKQLKKNKAYDTELTDFQFDDVYHTKLGEQYDKYRNQPNRDPMSGADFDYRSSGELYQIKKNDGTAYINESDYTLFNLNSKIAGIYGRNYPNKKAYEDAVKQTFDKEEYQKRLKVLTPNIKDGSESEIIKELNRILIGGKQRGGADVPKFVHPVPVLVPDSDEGKDAYRQITKIEKESLFDAVPENVIRLSLLNDMLALDTGKQKTVQITAPEFAAAIGGPVLFYNPFCPNCNNFMPIYIKLANMLKGKCPVGMVDCLDRFNGNDILSDYLNISGYPVVKVYNKGEFVDYSGGADLKKLFSFIANVLRI